MIQKFSLILLGLAVVLLFISVALIYNTIRLTVYSNRFLINTMRLVGATPWFIQKPYIGRSMLNGLIAAIVSLIMLVGMIFYIHHEFGMQGTLIPPLTAVFVSFIVIFLGILLTAASSYFAVGRYLRMHSNDMYFIQFESLKV